MGPSPELNYKRSSSQERVQNGHRTETGKEEVRLGFLLVYIIFDKQNPIYLHLKKMGKIRSLKVLKPLLFVFFPKPHNRNEFFEIPIWNRVEIHNESATLSEMKIFHYHHFLQTNLEFHLHHCMDLVKAGMESIIEDQVTSVFEAEELRSWNLLTRTNM